MALTTLLAILAGIAAATGVGGSITNAATSSNYDSSKESKIKNLMSSGMTRADAEYFYDQYKGTKFDFFNPSTWGARHGFNSTAYEQDYADYLDWKDKVGSIPQQVNIDQVLQEANSTIDSENAQINALYDEILGRSTDLYKSELENNNQAYNDFSRQILSNQAQSQNMMQGSVRSELDRSQRNAINRGATAAMRLVNNINTQLGLQNQAAQNALNTSNTLAQQLLNQRQAASAIRQGYASDLNADASRRAGLIQGSAERKLNYANGRLDQANNIYNQRMDQWNDRLNAYGGSNPFVNKYRNEQIKNQYSNGL